MVSQRLKGKEKVEKRRIDPVLAHFIFNEEQVILAKQRTALSFMRTGLGFVGVGVAITNFVAARPLVLVGIITTATGFYEIYRAYKILHKYEGKLHALKQVIHENGLDYYEHIEGHKKIYTEIELKM